MTQLTIIIIDKGGSLKTLAVKDYKVDELYKKCGFKKADGFDLQVEWSVKLNGQKYLLQMYGKLDGKANMENKYDFPPPDDNKLYFGSCAVVGFLRDDSNRKEHVNLSIDLWNKLYEKLFGGFTDLTATCNEDENEDDELDNIPSHKLTKTGGYLKDGFVVDSSDEEVLSDESDGLDVEVDCDGILEDIGSELSEEEYVE
jgi:hypothetical protein